jgi:integrase/recombinase XerD
MAYQYKREPLTPAEADKLYQVCNSVQETLIIWILLDTGLRVSELCSLTPQNILWQQKYIRISGKGGPYGKKTKKKSGTNVQEGSITLRTLLCNK